MTLQNKKGSFWGGGELRGESLKLREERGERRCVREHEPKVAQVNCTNNTNAFPLPYIHKRAAHNLWQLSLLLLSIQLEWED